MKKFLLLAAGFAALTMSAQETAPAYEINKISEQKVTVANVTDTRQAFGMNGNFYVAEMNFSGSSNGKVMVVTPNGPDYTDIDVTGSAISRDEAGNLILPATTFPNSWVADWDTPAIRVIDLATGDEVIHPLPADFENIGRSDALGFAKGDLMTDGVLYMVGSTFGANVGVLVITDGEVNADESYVANMSASITVNSQSLNHYFVDAEGNEKVFHVTRNAAPQMMEFDGDNLACTGLALPNKGASVGAHPFVFDGKNFVVYPTLPNYLDGFAIAEVGAETATVEVPAVATANPNGSQSNWLNAEVVDENTVRIYQYVPGNDLGHATIYEFTKVNTAVSNVNAAKNIASVKYINVAGQMSSEAFNGVNMVVTTYTDGSQTTTKVVK